MRWLVKVGCQQKCTLKLKSIDLDGVVGLGRLVFSPDAPIGCSARFFPGDDRMRIGNGLPDDLSRIDQDGIGDSQVFERDGFEYWPAGFGVLFARGQLDFAGHQVLDQRVGNELGAELVLSELW